MARHPRTPARRPKPKNPSKPSANGANINTPDSSSPKNDAAAELSGGAFFGILAGLFLVLGVVLYWRHCRRSRRENKSRPEEPTEKTCPEEESTERTEAFVFTGMPCDEEAPQPASKELWQDKIMIDRAVWGRAFPEEYDEDWCQALRHVYNNCSARQQ